MYLPEVDLKIESTTIKAVNRKLKATWTYEAAQDLQAWGISSAVEDELTKALADAINEEIDNEILNDLRDSAEKPWGFRKKKRPVRKITDDWEPSKQD